MSIVSIHKTDQGIEFPMPEVVDNMHEEMNFVAHCLAEPLFACGIQSNRYSAIDSLMLDLSSYTLEERLNQGVSADEFRDVFGYIASSVVRIAKEQDCDVEAIEIAKEKALPGETARPRTSDYHIDFVQELKQEDVDAKRKLVLTSRTPRRLTSEFAVGWLDNYNLSELQAIDTEFKQAGRLNSVILGSMGRGVRRKVFKSGDFVLAPRIVPHRSRRQRTLRTIETTFVRAALTARS